MTVEYYLLAPVILTDTLFFQYNPSLCETGTYAQRQAAYLIAEQQMMQYLGTFLTPTTVTGSYLWPVPYHPVLLDHKRVHSIDRLVVTSFDDACSCDLTENPGCATIRDPFHAIIDPQVIAGAARSLCGCGPGDLYLILCTYTAGLPTGVAANDLGLQTALGLLAGMHLQEMLQPGSWESMAGITSWSADGYSETRKFIQYTAFGASSLAQYIDQLVRHLKGGMRILGL
jgi:hypothetical protein